MTENNSAYPLRLPNGEWRCILDNRTEPCGECVGCREVQAENALAANGEERSSAYQATLNITPEQARMLAIGMLTSAANALTMGNEKADAHALTQAETALRLVQTLGNDDYSVLEK